EKRVHGETLLADHGTGPPRVHAGVCADRKQEECRLPRCGSSTRATRDDGQNAAWVSHQHTRTGKPLEEPQNRVDHFDPQLFPLFDRFLCRYAAVLAGQVEKDGSDFKWHFFVFGRQAYGLELEQAQLASERVDFDSAAEG